MSSAMELPEPRMPEGFNEHDFIFSKLFKSVNLIGQDVLCDVVRAMYSHSSMETDGGTLTLREYTKKEKWSGNKMKDVFTKLHMPLLDKDLNTVAFDISFAHKVMTDVCPELYGNLSKECQDNIDDLKKMRNKICHNYGIESEELNPKIESLKAILKNIYEGVGTIVGTDFTSEISAMQETLDEILSARVAQDATATYLEDVARFRENLKFIMINKGKEELRSHYSKLRILNPCIWMSDAEVSATSSLKEFKTDKIFTPLRIEDRRSTIEMKELLTVTGRIKGSEEVPCALLMHGLAGCGKTSLCHYLIQESCKEGSEDIAINGLGDFDLVIFVEVRRTRSGNLRKFLREERLKKTCENFKPDDIIPTLQDLDVLFVIDGFDEAKQHSSLELVNDIFSRFHQQRIVLTTRPEYLSDANYISRKFRASFLVVQICGFDEAGIKEFSKKVFTAIIAEESVRKKELQSFLNYIDGPGRVLDVHLKLPLTIALLIFLWKEDPSIVLRVSSATQLYCEIFKLCQKRLKERLEKIKRNDLDSVLDELLFCLGKHAWLLLLEGELMHMQKRDINILAKECKKRLVDLTNFLSTYLCCDTDENEDSPDRIYVFLHKTQMEYLAGAFLAESVDTADNQIARFKDIDTEVRKKESSWRRLQEVIKFMTGSFAIKESLDDRKIPEIFSFLKKAEIYSTDYNFWWSFYTESLKNRSVGLEIIRDHLPGGVWKLDSLQVVSGLQFHLNLPVRLEDLCIDIPLDVDPYDIKGFLPLMRKIQYKFKNKKRNGGNITPVNTELHLMHQESYRDSKSSNDFVGTLNPWAHLTNFTGKLDEREALSYCRNLRTIRVRLDTAEALRAFKGSLSRIYKKVRVLRVTLGVPFTCPPSDLCPLEYTNKLELTIKGTKDDDVPWIVETLKQINGR